MLKRGAKMQKKNELFTTMPVGKAVAKLAVPTVISQIVIILYSLADTFFVGQIGDPNQLAALKIPCYDSELIEKIAEKQALQRNTSRNSASTLYLTACTITRSRAEPTTVSPTRTSCGSLRRTL